MVIDCHLLTADAKLPFQVPHAPPIPPPGRRLFGNRQRSVAARDSR
jgi:hypothetical protein